MKNNIQDIAALAGVSPATVSNALNGRRGVSAKTRDEIQAIAREVGYLKDGGPAGVHKFIRFVIYRRHGFVVSDTPFFTSLIEGIEKECRQHGFEVMITHISHNEKAEKDIMETINKDNTAGVLILATEMGKSELELLQSIRVPIVLLDNYFINEKYDSVLINNAEGAYRAAEFLIRNGHSRIGYLHSSVEINNFNFRKAGYREALQDHGLTPDSSYEICLEPTMEGAYKDLSAYFERRDRVLPTAFFCDNDIIAAGAMRAFEERGYKVPEELSIIGFDDMPFCEMVNPRLTTVKVFKQKIGSIAVRRLLAKLTEETGTGFFQKIEVNTELVIRESTRPLKTNQTNGIHKERGGLL